VTVRFSPAARADLLEIASYIAADNAVRAATFVDGLEEKCNALGRAPGIGTRRPELGKGILALAAGRYLIFYREQDGHIRVERILHGSRDIGASDLGAT